MGLLDGKVALVTGGGRSIGKAFSTALAREGAAVVIADIAEEAPATARTLAAEYGVETMSKLTDVTRESDVKALVEAVIARFKRIDILVNNAALFADMPKQPYDEISVDLWDQVMAVNVRGVFLMCKHVAPHMVRAKSGKIINIGSGTAHKGVPNMLAYVSSKGAILGLTRSLAREVGPHGVNVNTLSPGLTESESVLKNPHHLSTAERTIATRAMPRAETPADLVGALIFLASSQSDFVTAQTIAVDGGAIVT
ncbi:MAG: SDR family oxidoreductase [Hyphomicrobiales bacterium]|nr:SDR family oxidoreductase [Hyphomicrobiales bacterium]